MAKIIFYSRYCAHSKKFLEVFKDSCDTESFNYICVDRDPRTRKRHPLIRQMDIMCVPTVVVSNNKIYGKDAFIWLREQIKVNGIKSINTRPEKKEKEGVEVDNDELFKKDKIKYYDYSKDDATINTPDADDIVDEKTGDVVYCSSAMNRRKKRKGDTLKSKQEDNKYHQLLKQREEMLKK